MSSSIQSYTTSVNGSIDASTVQTLTNKRLRTCYFVDDTATQTKRIRIVPDGQSANVDGTLASAATTARTWTLPDASGTISLGPSAGSYVDTTTAQNVGGVKTFTDNFKLNNAADTFATTFSTAATANRAVNVPDAAGDVVLDTATQTLTNKTLTSGTNTFPSTLVATTGAQSIAGTKTFTDDPKINNAADTFATTLSSSATANRAVAFPDLAGNVVLDSGAQTLSGKTLTAPVIATMTNGGTVSVPSGATGTMALLNGNNQWTGTTMFGTGSTITQLCHGRYDHTTGSILSQNGENTAAISFGETFASAPKVLVSLEHNSISAGDVVTLTLGTITTTTFVARIYNTHPTAAISAGGHVFFNWMAWR